jgi:hypothetical protein
MDIIATTEAAAPVKAKQRQHNNGHIIRIA